MDIAVPLVVNADGRRLAKRDRSVTLADLAADGVSPDRMLTGLARSLGLAGATESVTPAQLVNRFDARSRHLNVAPENSEMRASITANTIPLPSYPCDENA